MRAEAAGPVMGSVAAAQRTVLAALGALALTAVHHVYGAYIYGTPWRNHAAHVSGVAAVALLGSLVVFRLRAGSATGVAALWVMMLTTLLLPVAGIGLFEGGYNHAAKLALYFGDGSISTMRRFFPPPTYELPNDVFFEATGVLQLALGLVAGHQLRRLWLESGKC